MDYHMDWKDFNRQAIGIAAIVVLLCGSLYYFFATAYANADFLRHQMLRDSSTD